MNRDQAHPADFGPWVPYFETTEFQYLGDPWPRYVVTMWERNTIGETRMVRSRIYGPDDVGTTEATGSIASIEETHGTAYAMPPSIVLRGGDE